LEIQLDLIPFFRNNLPRPGNISFIHEIAENSVEDVTEAILAEAALPQVPPEDVDLQAIRHDHARDLRKHEKA
jgi:hypothetical protein